MSYTFWPDFLGKKKEAIAHLQTLIDQQEVGARPEQKHIETARSWATARADKDEAKKVWNAACASRRRAPGKLGL